MNVHRRIRSLCRDEDGQALVELALVLPLLLILVFAIVDFGLALNTENTADNIANIAVRQAAVIASGTSNCSGSSSQTLPQYVSCEITATGSGMSVCNVAVSDTTTSGSYTAGDSIQVAVSTDFNWLSIISGGVGGIGGTGITKTTITQTATMRLEQTPSTANKTTFFVNSPSNTC